MLDRRHLLTSTAALAGLTVLGGARPAFATAVSVTLISHFEVARFIDKDTVEVIEGRGHQVMRVGDVFRDHTLMAIVPGEAPFVVLEDFTRRDGHMLIVDKTGVRHDFTKTQESTAIDYSKGFLGHSEAEVRASATDLLGNQILSKPGDPDYDEVAAVFPPIRKVWGDTYNFLGSPETTDKIWFAYGGRSPNFDPAVYQPSVDQIRKDGKVWDGLVGGYLPCLRFVYPEDSGAWTELLAYAPFRVVNGNTRVQPVWYRVSRIEGGKRVWSKHVDSYLPYPPRESDDATQFYGELQGLKTGWDRILSQGMKIDVPDERVGNMARFGLVRAIMGRSAGYPKYGAVDKNYGGSEHDGFPDTFTVETEAMVEWGLIDRAGQYIDNYLGEFVRDDGVILYRGPETGQFGRMLTVMAQYITAGGDAGLLIKHRTRIDAITNMLLGLRAKALKLPKDDPAYGMLSGWSEADAVLESDPQRYMQPYFSNSTEAVRGFRDLGRVWEKAGRARGDAELAAWGQRLINEASALRADLQTSISRSILVSDGKPMLPVIAGAKEPFHVVLERDRSDPQWRAYRSNMEMLHSGNLTREQVAMIVDYRAAHHDVVLGMPMAYGYNTGEMAGFLSYGHGYGLIQIDRIRDALLMTYSDMAHQYTRGMWLAPETRRPLADDFASAWCGPSQLVASLMTRWLLVFEDPEAEVLWLGKGMPRAWLENEKVTIIDDIATRWGRISFATDSDRKKEQRIAARIVFPAGGIAAETRLRLRSHDQAPIRSVTVNGKAWRQFDAASETITLPAGLGGELLINARY